MEKQHASPQPGEMVLPSLREVWKPFWTSIKLRHPGNADPKELDLFFELFQDDRDAIGLLDLFNEIYGSKSEQERALKKFWEKRDIPYNQQTVDELFREYGRSPWGFKLMWENLRAEYPTQEELRLREAISRHRRRLIAFYKFYVPDRTEAEVLKILSQFSTSCDNLDQMWKYLHLKYGPDPPGLEDSTESSSTMTTSTASDDPILPEGKVWSQTLNRLLVYYRYYQPHRTPSLVRHTFWEWCAKTITLRNPELEATVGSSLEWRNMTEAQRKSMRQEMDMFETLEDVETELFEPLWANLKSKYGPEPDAEGLVNGQPSPYKAPLAAPDSSTSAGGTTAADWLPGGPSYTKQLSLLQQYYRQLPMTAVYPTQKSEDEIRTILQSFLNRRNVKIDVLWNALKVKYESVPHFSPLDDKINTQRLWQRYRLKCFYSYWAPTKATEDNLTQILHLYVDEGKEDLLWTTLHQKYGPDPPI